MNKVVRIARGVKTVILTMLIIDMVTDMIKIKGICKPSEVVYAQKPLYTRR